jgi:hypothetical protein
MRSGTSMMMEALSKGGLEAAFDPKRDEFVSKCADGLYRPNPRGVFEISFAEYSETGFPLRYEGKLIKVFPEGLSNLALHQYRVVFMLRDPEEIRQSYEAMFSTITSRRVQLNNYRQKMDAAIDYLKSRSDVQLNILEYRNVVQNPVSEFSYLRSEGWPIDPEKAASVVDPNLYRFRRERLTVGA